MITLLILLRTAAVCIYGVYERGRLDTKYEWCTYTVHQALDPFISSTFSCGGDRWLPYAQMGGQHVARDGQYRLWTRQPIDINCVHRAPAEVARDLPNFDELSAELVRVRVR